MNSVYTVGTPPPKSFRYTKRPAGLSCSDLTVAHEMCVARINEYRSGARKFTNQLADPTLGTTAPLKWASGMDKCHSGKQFANETTLSSVELTFATFKPFRNQLVRL